MRPSSTQKALQDSLAEKEGRFQSLVSNIPGVVYQCRPEPDWTLLFVSDEVERLTGYPAQQFTGGGGQGFDAIIHGDDLRRVRREILEAVEALRAWEVEYRLLPAGGGTLWVRDRGRAQRDPSGAVAHLDGLILDVTAEREAHRRLRTRLSLEQVAAKASSRFLSATTTDQFSEAVERTLADLGVLLSVDRGYLFRVSPGLSRMENTHEWCAPGLEPRRDQLHDLATEAIPWARDQLMTGKPLIIPDVSTLPSEAAAERELFVAQGVRSMVNVPIRSSDGRFVGFVGFDAVRRTLNWRDEEVAILRVLADTVGAALGRLRNEERLKEAKEAAEAASRAKSRFLADLSHETRSPPTEVTGLAGSGDMVGGLSRRPAASFGTRTVLVAEDVGMNMLLIRSLIQGIMPGVRVVEALDGAAAVQAVLDGPVDLILMDVQMPEMDGVQATRKIRKLERGTGHRTPIVGLTSGTTRDERKRAMESGMNHVLTKPIDAAELEEVLRLHLEVDRP